MWVQRSAEYVVVVEKLAQASTVHRHYVLQLSLGLSGPLAVVVGKAALPPVPGFLTGPNVPHMLSGDVLHIFVDPLQPLGRQLRGMLAKQTHLTLDASQTACFFGGSDSREWLTGPPHAAHDEAVSALMAALARVHTQPPLPPIDARIARVIRRLRDHLDARVPLEMLADEARLSPGRLTHLFTQEVGVSIKQYVVWLRLAAVLEAMESSAQLGTLAHTTGFPDQAAFSRAYHDAWGRTPTAFRTAARVVEPELPALDIAAGIKRS